MNWVLIIVAVVALFVFLRFREIRHRVTHIVIILLVVLLAGSVATVYFSNDVDLTSFEGIAHAGKVYFSWLGAIFGNIGKVSTYAVHQDWGTSPPSSNETVEEQS